MIDGYEKGSRFKVLHEQGSPLLLPNAWDAGSARMLEAAGAQAIGTTSAGLAFSAARTDGTMSAEAVLSNAADIAAAVGVPVTADLLNGFSETTEGVAAMIEEAIEVGLAGASIEDTTGRSETPLFPLEEAVARIAAARARIDASGSPFVLTARADAFFASMVLPNVNPDLEDVVRRLKAFADAGADVVYAPGVTETANIRRLIDAVDVPVNVLVGLPGMAQSVEDYSKLGAKRLSVGSSLFSDAYGAAQAAFQNWAQTGIYRRSEIAFDYAQASKVMAGSKA